MAKAKRIYVPHAYTAIGGLSLAPGEYDYDDLVLQGKAQYLLDAGLASAVVPGDDDKLDDVPPSPEPPVTTRLVYPSGVKPDEQAIVVPGSDEDKQAGDKKKGK